MLNNHAFLAVFPCLTIISGHLGSYLNTGVVLDAYPGRFATEEMTNKREFIIIFTFK